MDIITLMFCKQEPFRTKFLGRTETDGKKHLKYHIPYLRDSREKMIDTNFVCIVNYLSMIFIHHNKRLHLIFVFFFDWKPLWDHFSTTDKIFWTEQEKNVKEKKAAYPSILCSAPDWFWVVYQLGYLKHFFENRTLKLFRNFSRFRVKYNDRGTDVGVRCLNNDYSVIILYAWKSDSPVING